METSPKKIIVVLGMHRSGTSALTRSLKAFNVSLGDNLMKRTISANAKGYWEDLSLHAINQRILNKLNHSWDSLELITQPLLESKAIDKLRKQARALLEDKMRNTDAFAFKDPRTSILLPFWQPIFRELGLKEHYLIALRNPLDVAKSLEKRDRISHLISFILWSKYTIAACQHTENRSRLLISYENLLENPQNALDKISKSFGLTIDKNESKPFVNTFVSKELQHHQSSLEELVNHKEIPVYLLDIYSILQKATSNELLPETLTKEDIWNKAVATFSQQNELYKYIDKFESRQYSHLYQALSCLKTLKNNFGWILRSSTLVIKLLKKLDKA